LLVYQNEAKAANTQSIGRTRRSDVRGSPAGPVYGFLVLDACQKSTDSLERPSIVTAHALMELRPLRVRPPAVSGEESGWLLPGSFVRGAL